MSAFHASKEDLGRSGEALAAFFGGDDDDLAATGALIVADAIDCLRTVRNFLTRKK